MKTDTPPTTLRQAITQFNIGEYAEDMLEMQEEAFQICRNFLSGVEKIRTQNKRLGSYTLKHVVENPHGHYGIRDTQCLYAGYIYEGTLVAAALAEGFTPDWYGAVKATFNISEKSLQRRARATCGDPMRATESPWRPVER